LFSGHNLSFIGLQKESPNKSPIYVIREFESLTIWNAARKTLKGEKAEVGNTPNYDWLHAIQYKRGEYPANPTILSSIANATERAKRLSHKGF